ncbi:MAG: Gfo/Idh/MocA family oxidoreductase [Gemmatimonadota bacterium]
MTAPPLAMGVVGVGSLGFHHARILGQLEGVTRVGVYDTDRARAATVSEQLGVPAFDSLEELLARLDAVVVATPTHSHESVACAALERGVHVFIEKPIAPSLASADRILEAAARTQAQVQVGHVERFNAAVLAAQEYLQTPLFIEVHRMAPFVPRSTDVPVVLDLMIHDVDLVRAFVGQPIESIAATGVPVITGLADIANARLTFEGGAVANLTASRVSMERMRKIRVFQRSGYLSLDLARGTGEFLRLRGGLPALEGLRAGDPVPVSGGQAWEAALAALVERIPIVGGEGEPLKRELESFRDVLSGGGTPIVSGLEGRDALAVALSIEELIRSHVADSRTA